MDNFVQNQFTKLTDKKKFAFCLMILDRAFPYLKNHYEMSGRNYNPFDRAMSSFWNYLMDEKIFGNWNEIKESIYKNCVDSEVDGSFEGMITLNIGLSIGAVAQYLSGASSDIMNDVLSHMSDALSAFEHLHDDARANEIRSRELENERLDIEFLKSRPEIGDFGQFVFSRSRNYRATFT